MRSPSASRVLVSVDESRWLRWEFGRSTFSSFGVVMRTKIREENVWFSWWITLKLSALSETSSRYHGKPVAIAIPVSRAKMAKRWFNAKADFHPCDGVDEKEHRRQPASFVCNVTSATSTVVKDDARSAFPRTRSTRCIGIAGSHDLHARPFDSFVAEINPSLISFTRLQR